MNTLGLILFIGLRLSNAATYLESTYFPAPSLILPPTYESVDSYTQPDIFTPLVEPLKQLPPTYMNPPGLFFEHIDLFNTVDGTESGNGGFTVSCHGFDSQFADVYGITLDDSLSAECNGSSECLVDARIEQINIIHPELYKSLKQANQLFKVLLEVADENNEMYQLKSFHLDMPSLHLLYDSDEFSDTCVFTQLFSRISDKQSKQTLRYILLSSEDFQKLNANHQAAAILHEILYSIVFELHANTPDAFASVVKINKFIHQLPDLKGVDQRTLEASRSKLDTLLASLRLISK